jgi:hypothetical protein
VRYLTREELQGVIAHEFSHILYGDMVINLRLQGLLHGILVIGLLGEILLKSAFSTDRVGERSKGNGQGGGGFYAIVIGVVLLILGYTGVFVARLIKSAVARQREFLADAAAVQFTRNPLGLAGALKKIGGLTAGSKIRDAHASEVSHMFFGNGLSESWLNVFSTHPPLLARIQRLDPEFRGDFPERVELAPISEEEVMMYAPPAGKAAAAGSGNCCARSRGWPPCLHPLPGCGPPPERGDRQSARRASAHGQGDARQPPSRHPGCGQERFRGQGAGVRPSP